MITKTLLTIALVSLVSNPIKADTVERYTEYPSPMGDYNYLGVNELTVGTKATSPGTPSNAAESSSTIYGSLNVTNGETIIDEELQVDGNTWRMWKLPYWGGTFWTTVGVDPAAIPTGPIDEFEVYGDIFVKRFRASPFAGYFDRLLYFGPTPDGAWVEMGSLVGGSSTGIGTAGYADSLSVARFQGPTILLNVGTDPLYATNPNFSKGNVGIGTENPLFKLQVGEPGGSVNNVMGYNFEGFSSRAFKKDITALLPNDYRKAYDEVDNIHIRRFRYQKEGKNGDLHIGVIAEEAPDSITSSDHKSLDTTSAIGFMMAAVKSKNTSPELLFRRAIREKGIKYSVYSSKLPGKPDIVLKKQKTLVFVDGDFWHGRQWKDRGYKSLADQFSTLANKKYWVEKIQRNMARDQKVNRDCKKLGWRVVRFWECDINRKMEKCISKLMRKISVYESK